MTESQKLLKIKSIPCYVLPSRSLVSATAILVHFSTKELMVSFFFNFKWLQRKYIYLTFDRHSVVAVFWWIYLIEKCLHLIFCIAMSWDDLSIDHFIIPIYYNLIKQKSFGTMWNCPKVRANCRTCINKLLTEPNMISHGRPKNSDGHSR